MTRQPSVDEPAEPGDEGRIEVVDALFVACPVGDELHQVAADVGVSPTEMVRRLLAFYTQHCWGRQRRRADTVHCWLADRFWIICLGAWAASLALAPLLDPPASRWALAVLATVLFFAARWVDTWHRSADSFDTWLWDHSGVLLAAGVTWVLALYLLTEPPTAIWAMAAVAWVLIGLFATGFMVESRRHRRERHGRG